MTSIVSDIELEALTERGVAGPPIVESAWPILGAVRVRVAARVGEAEVTLRELLEMKHGAVLPLDRSVEQPLDILVADHVVARGTLVAVGDCFGVRITEPAAAGVANSGHTGALARARDGLEESA